MNKKLQLSAAIFAALMLSACSEKPVPYEDNADEHGFTAATEATIAANKAFADSLPFHNTEDFEQANRGLVAQEDDLLITNADGKPVWAMSEYDFINFTGPQGNAPATVNPSLWRQAAINNIHGLFELMPDIYQIRNYDLANMTLIRGGSGWIIVDPLTSSETAAKGFEFAQTHLGKLPVKAILFTHSHIDHFGGVEGILSLMSEEEKAELRIVAPRGFMEEATSENLIAGDAMGRRASYMYGRLLPKSERGHVGSGLGKSPAFGTFSIMEPTELVDFEANSLVIDGLEFEFQFTPESEAPAEFTFYLPKYKAFCGAELVSRTMHNLYTLRGAKVRDAQRWSSYIEDAITEYGDSELYFGSHHWPIWGSDKIKQFLTIQSDTYKYIHDQTVRMINTGYTPNEIAEVIELPESLQQDFSNRGYYGTLKHNSKAVYQFYMGWFTANPAALDPLPEEETAKRYIEMRGGIETVVAKAQQQFASVDANDIESISIQYRWLAQLLNQAVFSDPDNQAAKALLAKVYDQLGYLSESGPWRDFYLSGALELRNGNSAAGKELKDIKGLLLAMSVDQFLTKMSVNLNGEKATDKDMAILIRFTDTGDNYQLNLRNSVLRHQKAKSDNNDDFDVTIDVTRELFIDVLTGGAKPRDMIFSDDISVSGSKLDLLSFLQSFDKMDGKFNIVTP